MLHNLLVGLPTMLLCLVLQTTFTFWSVRYYVRASYSNAAVGARVAIWPLLIAMLILTAGNLLQITLWGALFLALGEFSEFYEALYHSGVNFASLGYGDIVMSRSWKLLGPLEAVNGVLMVGMSGAALMAMLQYLIKKQHEQRTRTG
ncbi:MAG TPA: ion channel [Candidatus Accumulibacter phosphatis]|nr:MAG: Ion channel [Candidatus Accumulibacter sp. SK-11]HAY26312.1 two pore domain potassium channel family protein [Accumulibacter sp.]HCN68476.1 two pore domain potassium channel family protein [Accumulibacter sp.]HRL77099.1 ion channel [Candidatus Accumulibacter phosphatis]HRQ94312.1 ion channel [Candidatus Accumulibacter phosphatis]